MAKKKVFSISSSLSAGLEQTIEAAQNYSSALRIDIIPIKKIELDPDNPRTMSLTIPDILDGLRIDDPLLAAKKEDLESLETLATSIKEQGIINPILVYERNGYYRLIAGERRTLASILAGKTDIQAKILDEKPDELKVRLLQWIENIERSDLTLKERMDNLEKIIAAFAKRNDIEPAAIRITDISQLIGCVKSHAINLKAVLNADGEIKQLIAENKIKNLEKAALLTAIKSPIVKQRAINDCVAGASLKKLKQYLEHDKLKSVDKANEASAETAEAISFGSTKNIYVAKTIIKSIINHDAFLKDHFEFESLSYESPQTITQLFKRLIKKLEETHA